MIFYFKLQYKRFYRLIDSTGFNPIIGGLIALSLFIIASNSFFEKINDTKILYPIFSLLSFVKLSSKKRNYFLKNIFSINKYRKIRLIENLVLSIPFLVFMLYKLIYINSIIFLFIALAISQFNKIDSLNFVIPTPFYKKPFEFIVGFRNTFLIFPLLYFITFMSINVQNFNLGIFSLIIVLLTPLTFYTKPEHSFYIWIHSINPSEFIYSKIKTAIIFSLALASPIIISLLIFFPIENADIIAMIIILALFILVTVILGKYSFYPSETPIQLLLIISCIGFPPLLLFVFPYFYSKSTQNLKKLL